MEPSEFGDALKKLTMGLGLKALEKLTSQLDPDQLMQQASQALGAELKETLTEILQDPEAAPLREIIDRLYEELDADQIISAVAKPLADQLAAFFIKEETGDLVQAIADALDLDEVTELVAQKIASRVQITQQ